MASVHVLDLTTLYEVIFQKAEVMQCCQPTNTHKRKCRKEAAKLDCAWVKFFFFGLVANESPANKATALGACCSMLHPLHHAETIGAWCELLVFSWWAGPFSPLPLHPCPCLPQHRQVAFKRLQTIGEARCLLAPRGHLPTLRRNGCPVHARRATFVLRMLSLAPSLSSPMEVPQVDRTRPQTFRAKHVA